MADNGLPRNVRRLFRLPWRSAASITRDVDDELRFHVEMRAAELMAAGLDAESVMAEAWRSFGSASDVREHAVAVNAGVMRRARLLELVASVVNDVRFAVRQARRTPLFTLVAVATLALGIGANTAIFSVVHRLLMAPFPFADSDRLALVWGIDRDYNAIILPSRQAFDAWRARARSFEAMSASQDRDVELRDGEHLATVKGGAMSANMLSMLRVNPLIGRGFAEADEVPGAAPVAMLAYEEWQTQFGGRPDILGRVVTVDSIARTVVGILPAGFILPFSSDVRSVWVPLGDRPGWRAVIGKVRKGVAIGAVNHELTAIAAQVPGARDGSRQTVEAKREQDVYSHLRRGVLLLFASVGVVLLIACANVANLLLVRAWSRKRELAIRAALGAGRARLTRLLVTECLVIATAGGAGGVALAWLATRVLITLRPPDLDVLDSVRIEPAALGWTMLITLGTALVFGLAPALFATSRGMTDGPRAGARESEGSRSGRAFSSSLIVAEIALSVTLLVGAGLLVRSFRAMDTVELGYAPGGLHSVTVRVGRATPRSDRRPMFAAFLRQLRETPGVRGAVFATDLPSSIGANGDGLQPEDRPASDAPLIVTSGAIDVQPGFFGTAGIHVRGRTFSADSTGMDSLPPHEIVVSERLARRLWPDADAIGRRLRVGKTSHVVVGVANNVISDPGVRGDQFDLQFYRPWSSLNDDDVSVVFRSELGDRVVDTLVQAVMRRVSPQLSVRRKATAEEQLRKQLAPTKFATALVGGFAVIALLLAVVGLYGVIAYTVGRRTREIGVRIALGAQSRDIARLVLANGGALVGAGLVGGIALSLAGTRLLEAYVFGVSQRDPITYAAIVTLLGAAALVAVYVPARRAMGVDPVIALSVE